MNIINKSFLLSILSGLSTMLGTIPIFISFKQEKRIIISSLAFAAGVMLCISITDLIPESMSMFISYTNNGLLLCIMVFFYVFLGINIASFIDKKISIPNNQKKLYHIGIISMLVIILHNIPEGIATFISTTKNISLGISIATAIALHNIPEGISISIPIYYSTNSKLKAIAYTFIASMSEPFGALLTYLFLIPIINNYLLGCLFSLIAGLMIEISLNELLKTSLEKKDIKLTTISFIIGIFLMLLKIIFK